MKPTLTLILFLIAPLAISAQDSSPKCPEKHHEIFKSYLGTWEEYRVEGSNETFTGTLTSKLDLMGCAITQRFVAKDSTFIYQTLGFLDPTSNLWEETYVFSSGSMSTFQWVRENGITYQLRTGGSRTLDHIYRLEFTEVKDNEYAVIGQRSNDNGQTWVKGDTTRIKKIH